MNIVPLAAVPNQSFSIVLGGQNCRIAVYQKSTGMYADLYVNTTPIFTCVSCLDRDPLVQEQYLGFSGDLAFVDTQGTDDPDYTGLGSRFLLAYFTPADLGE